MSNIKVWIKSHKKIFIVGIGILIVSLALGIYSIYKTRSSNAERGNTSDEITNIYTAFISINPLVKLTFSDNCIDDLCVGNPKIISYELINDDAKTLFKDYDFSELELYEILELMSEVIRDNGVVIDTVNIYSDWENFNEYLEENVDDNEIVNYRIEIKHNYELEDLAELMKSDKVVYTVSFDSNGGISINNQIIEEGKMIEKPKNPTRNGYTFVEWQYNGKKYDFNSTITKNVELKAVWKKIEETSSNDNETSTDKPSSKEEIVEEKVLGSYPLLKRTDSCIVQDEGTEWETTYSEWAFDNISNLVDKWISYYGYFYTDTKYVYIAEELYIEFAEYGRIYWTDEKCQPLAASPAYGLSNAAIKNYVKTYKVGNVNDIGALLPQYGYKVKCTKDKCWTY